MVQVDLLQEIKNKKILEVLKGFEYSFAKFWRIFGAISVEIADFENLTFGLYFLPC